MFPVLGDGPSAEAEAEAIKAGRDRQLQLTKAEPADH